jgi:GMP synthase (glutamine-hydrolysing)
MTQCPSPSTDTGAPILYHDGCRLCLDIALTLGAAIPGLQVVDLCLHPGLAPQARERGVTELPSLVIGTKVLPVAPHSDLAHTKT